MKIRIVLTIFWGLLTILVISTASKFYLTKFSNVHELESLAIICLKISLFACLWVFLLTRNDMIFGWYRRFLYELADYYATDEGKLDPVKRLMAEDLLKPLLTCEICVGSNIAFWVYVSMSRKEFILLDFLFLISFTGLITLLSTETWQKATK